MYYLINLSTSGNKKAYNLFTAFMLVFTVAIFQSSAFAQVLFEDNFETGNLSKNQNGVQWGSQASTAVNTVNPRSGSYSLEFTFAGVANGQDSFAEQRFALGGNYPEVWIKYDLFIPTNYYHRTQTGSSSNNKSFVHLWTGEYSSRDGIGGGFEMWPNGNGFGTLKFHPFRPDFSHIDDTKRYPAGIDANDLGKWMQLVIQVKAGAAGSNDYLRGAKVRVWKSADGGPTSLIYSLDNAWFADWQDPSNILYSSSGQNYFNNGYLLGWSNSGFSQATKLYIDNVVIATTPLVDIDPPAYPAPDN